MPGHDAPEARPVGLGIDPIPPGFGPASGLESPHSAASRVCATIASDASDANDLAFYREALDSAAIVEVTDLAGTILSANDKFCEISGYSREELIGVSHKILRSGVHDEAFLAQIRATAERGRIWKGEICHRAKNGRFYWLETTVVPHRRCGGQIDQFIAIRFDITAQKQAESQLRWLANVDDLTELPNRNNFIRSLADSIDGEHGETVIGVMDIDHFKDINDSLGHGAGDKLLREIAIRLRATMGERDEIARLGGDEFGLILRDVGRKGALHDRVKRIFAVFAEPLPIGLGERMLTASIGLTRVSQDRNDRDNLLKYADIALHEAKLNGRGRAEMFGQEMQQRLDRRTELCNAFERGLHSGEFVVHYQPIVALLRPAPAAMEALLRWNHPEHGMVRPPQFLDALADEHLAMQVGGFVLGEVIAQIGRWRAAGVRFTAVSVNATIGDLRARHFVDTILAEIARGSIAPADLCVEITEDVLIGRGGVCARSEIERLHQAGVAVAFDDFGTGFASLRHLRDLPVAMIKIDKSFVLAIEHDMADRAIVRNVIELAHALGKTVTAEGVESVEQAAILRALGCDRIQGFVISPAVAPEEVEPILRASLARSFAQREISQAD
jgi:diguanylate cyclase (GGDEF)-like protein/PAS domain S-box-containing protein